MSEEYFNENGEAIFVILVCLIGSGAIIYIMLIVPGIERLDLLDEFCIEKGFNETTDWKYKRIDVSNNDLSYYVKYLFVECDEVVLDYRLMIKESPYCTEENKWGNCINGEKDKWLYTAGEGLQ